MPDSTFGSKGVTPLLGFVWGHVLTPRSGAKTWAFGSILGVWCFPSMGGWGGLYKRSARHGLAPPLRDTCLRISKKIREKIVPGSGVSPFCISLCRIFHCEKVTPTFGNFLMRFSSSICNQPLVKVAGVGQRVGSRRGERFPHNPSQPPIEGKHLTPKVGPPFDPAFGVQNLTPPLGPKGCGPIALQPP
jgi:hypothetical protein